MIDKEKGILTKAKHLYSVMVSGIRTIYPRRLNKRFFSKFCRGSRVRHETSDQGRNTLLRKHFEYKNENNSPYILNDKKYQASSQMLSK